jgi:hypothetical protein
MKAFLPALLFLALGLAGCSSTNDRGVNINRSTDIFGADPAKPAITTPATAAATTAKPSGTTA